MSCLSVLLGTPAPSIAAAPNAFTLLTNFNLLRLFTGRNMWKKLVGYTDSRMSRGDFVHLHTHSHYSLLEAIPKIPELVAAAAKDGARALALTDNGNLYGAIEFYKERSESSVK